MESLTKALDYLNLAVEKDPAWAAPYAGIAQVWVEWNWEKGEREFLRALAINPSDALQTAMVYLEKALAMDPEDYFANNIMEFSAMGCGEYEKAIEAMKIYLPVHGIITTEMERIFNEQGFEHAYEETLNLMEIAAQKGMYSPADLAMRFLIRGKHEKGMDYYETGFEMHDQNMPYISTFAGDNYINSNPWYLAILE